MLMRRFDWSTVLSALLMAVLPPVSSAWAQTPPPAIGVWDSVRSANETRTLSFQGTASLLGKSVPMALHFFCSTVHSKDVQGALGFDLHIMAVDKLADFHFDDFEGPDATTRDKNLMRATVQGSHQAMQPLSASPSGSYAAQGEFVFEVSAVSRQPHSPAKSILKALSDSNAESLILVITDARNAKVKLELSIPLAGKHGEFKALLDGLR